MLRNRINILENRRALLMRLRELFSAARYVPAANFNILKRHYMFSLVFTVPIVEGNYRIRT